MIDCIMLAVAMSPVKRGSIVDVSNKWMNLSVSNVGDIPFNIAFLHFP